VFREPASAEPCDPDARDFVPLVADGALDLRAAHGPLCEAALAARWAQLTPEEQERFAVPWAGDAVKRGTIAWSLLSRLAQGPVGSAEIQRAIGHEGHEVAGVWIAWLRARGLAEHAAWGQWVISERGKIVAKYPRTEAFSRKEEGRTK
jgi:hypothetical protein